eukprot:scaffold34177_cov69-Phaeocystis_antarctica.AAC.4
MARTAQPRRCNARQSSDAGLWRASARLRGTSGLSQWSRRRNRATHTPRTRSGATRARSGRYSCRRLLPRVAPSRRADLRSQRQTERARAWGLSPNDQRRRRRWHCPA